MDKEGLRLEIELLEGKTKGYAPEMNRAQASVNVLLAIHSKEVSTYITSFIKLTYPLWNLRHANDALEAYAQLENEPSDLLICEFCMPYLTGYGLMKKLNTCIELRQIPKVLISPEPLQKIIDEDMVLISDPFDPIELKSAFDKLLNCA